MIKTITVTNHLGNSLAMPLAKPEISGFIIMSISGLGPVKASINSTELASTDGSLYNSARLSERNIVLDLRFFGHEIEQIRLKCYKYFPIKKQVTLKIETDSRIMSCVGYIESNEPNIFDENEGSQISIICPDPYFYSVEDNEENKVSFSSLTPEFEFPFCNDSLTENLLEMGDIELLRSQTVYYEGDSETGITINLHAMGPVVNPTIYNLGTRESMSIDTTKLETLTGVGLDAGDDVTIVTERGNKRVTLLRAGVEINILNCLNRNADWFMLSKGDNIFTYTADYGSSNMQLAIDSRIVYEGV